MLNLSAKIRKEKSRKTKSLRKKGKIPAIFYGPKLKNISLELDYKSFEKVYKEAGESSLVSLKIKGEKKIYQVIIYDVQEDPLTGNFIHIDLYQPSLEKKIEATVPLEFFGESEAIKNLGGTLVKNITEIQVKALPQDLPHQIRVNIENLKTFEEHIKISDLEIPKEVEVLKDAQEIVVSVLPPTKVEEELEKPIEEKVEEVEKVEEKKKEKEEKEEEKEEPSSTKPAEGKEKLEKGKKEQTSGGK